MERVAPQPLHLSTVFLFAQLEKNVRAHVTTAHALNFITMLQTYQTMFLAELRAQVSLEPSDNLHQVKITTDYILFVSCYAALYLGCRSAPTVVAQKHLWLTLSDITDRNRAVYLNDLVTDGELNH